VLTEDQLVGSLLLSGRFGERLWTHEPGARWGLPAYAGNPGFEVPTGFRLGGPALVEFRLKTGLIHFPLAVVEGCMHLRLKPLPNREQCSHGLSAADTTGRSHGASRKKRAFPRHLFGQIKKGGPRVPVPERLSWMGRKVYSLWMWSRTAPVRILIMRLTGDRLNPAWRLGSFAVQRGVEQTIRGYLSALSGAVSMRAQRSTL
jgi:hypothetical protein